MIMSDVKERIKKVTADTLTLEPESQQTLEYKLTTYHGVRTEEWDRKQQD